jgi:hypothetical protein
MKGRTDLLEKLERENVDYVGAVIPPLPMAGFGNATQLEAVDQAPPLEDVPQSELVYKNNIPSLPVPNAAVDNTDVDELD